MNRIVPLPILIALSLLALSIYLMFNIKYQVRNLKIDVTQLNKQIIDEKESIKVLEAEWAYLNKPERLMRIASKYLPHLEPIQVMQLNPKLVPLANRQKFIVEVIKNHSLSNQSKTVNYRKPVRD
ncbi:cell division protein FtsL [Rickettsiales endosymbiont of Stachyamoeba lipophora]|uniref:cell division protein FtsL n=1 Tax=Rickettsiales endosymbiont of Stachyamoeba lipophora TaxID=2486578 RepID=UPI000F64EF92|nr:hypothetical protein [Rickettsiales endosymbiont of Stachyamoeba lipophora]AZL15309.1 hypothetical protein EF513_01895 [Rickettsiales endosymbiont of Stachyamoeba lipophora]